ncbi:ATP citrate synthase [Candidatus Micrarchaeota archaeon]|nr:ATP citrate synthase [Candidatus Micrarchaeota archaeon]
MAKPKTEKRESYEIFSNTTRAFVYNLKAGPIQRMLDFDFLCKREDPSVAGIINPGSSGWHKAFFGKNEILIPVFPTVSEAVKAVPYADVMVNLASFRSAYDSSKEALESKTIRTVAIIAEGMPERQSRELIALAKKRGKWIIGPATVGGIKSGCFRIGNTAGTIENITNCRLYRPGSVGLVSKSGGMSNEMFNVIAQNSDGVNEGIAIGGDAFPGSTLLDHLLRFETNPDIKMSVVLGELGGKGEYDIVEAKKAGRLTKPLIGWCIGTCAKVFPTEVQFGHAGAKSGKERETADAKNKAMREAGIAVPESFEGLGAAIKTEYERLKKEGRVKDVKEPELPKIPQDYAAALKSGSVRRSANFMCTISDDRGEDVLYGGVPLTEIIEKDYSVGDVISLLWFKRRLPKYAAKYIELCMIVAADHGPCVSGAHNAIVASRAGKDVVSSLASGLLTIGPRFGGAIDDAARYFKAAADSGMPPEEFVEDMKRKAIRIPGIGHRIKSRDNPDKRVEFLKAYTKKHFPETKYLDYALAVEKVTLEKANNLILNVDGCIGVTCMDLLSSCKAFSKEELDSIVEIGYLNGLFVLSRSIGLMGHIYDQKRLKADLYRHPWDDVLFLEK